MRLAIAVVLLVILYASPAVSAENNSNETIITVDSTNLRFSPSTVTINEGDTIRFFWDGQFLPHNAVEENETFDSGDTASDEDYPFVFVFGLNGTFDYHCEPHRSLGMVGQIIVNPLPPAENNTTEDDLIVEMEDEDEAFMPFLTMPSISAAIALAALLRDKESDD
ncbi:MAG: plastocyanin/azurin family copper-binding protein [Candidatus Poseidoniales archaeon]